MNFKKFISGVSALTIAASAFAGMAVTANAAVTAFSESYSSTSTTDGWSTGTKGRFTPAILNEDDNYFLSVAQGERNNNGANVTGTVVSGKAAAGDNFVLEFNLKLGSSNGRNAQNNTEFKVMDSANSGVIFSLKETTNTTDKWVLNGTTTQVTLSGSNAGDADISTMPWYKVIIARSGSLNYITINDSNGDAIFERTDVEASSTGGLGNITFASSRYNANFAIDNIVVRELQNGDVPAVTTGRYTVEYVTENDTTLEKTASGEGIVGRSPSLSASARAAFVENGKKYIYVSDNSASVTIASDNSAVVTVTVREAETWDYTVKSSLGTTIATGSVFEGDSARVSYSQYLLSGKDLYEAGKHDDSYKEYNWTFTPDKDNYELTIPYSKSSITNVVFYAEGEDIDTLTPINANHINIRASKSYAGTSSTDAVITTLPAGYYKIYGRTACSANDAADVSVKLGETTIASYNHNKNSNTYDFNSGAEAVHITSPTALTFASSNTTDVGLDFIYVVEATTEDAFVFTKPLSELMNLNMYVTRSSDNAVADPVAVSSLDTTTYSGTGDAQLAIIFENVPVSWGTLSVVLK